MGVGVAPIGPLPKTLSTILLPSWQVCGRTHLPPMQLLGLGLNPKTLKPTPLNPKPTCLQCSCCCRCCLLLLVQVNHVLCDSPLEVPVAHRLAAQGAHAMARRQHTLDALRTEPGGVGH